MRAIFKQDLTDKEIDLLVQAFLLPLPFGFTASEFYKLSDRAVEAAESWLKVKYPDYEKLSAYWD